MKTRREMAAALMGWPLVAGAVTSELTRTPQADPIAGSHPDSPPNSKQELLRELNPYSEKAALIISYTLYGEARGESVEGKTAVASVIKTRSMRSGKSLAEVCLQDRQFSCWNNLTTVPEFYITGEGIPPGDMKARSECFAIAWILMVTTTGWDYFTHFYNPEKAAPDWAAELRGVRTIGNHTFGFIN